MKKNISFVGMVILVTTSAIFPNKWTSVCEGQLYGKFTNREAFITPGAGASDQTLANYIVFNPNDHRCAISANV